PSLAWVRVFERHKSGALHVHFISSRTVRKRHLARLWGHGFVDAGRAAGTGGREMARSAARYAAKYIGKSTVAGFGRHSYEVRQGFQPAVRLGRFAGDAVAWTEVVRAMGGELPSYEWRSTGVEGWRGPPVLFLSW